MGVELLHKNFQDLNILVTGVSSGIGYAVAKAYDERGANVFGVDINKISHDSAFNPNSIKVSQVYNKVMELKKLRKIF